MEGNKGKSSAMLQLTKWNSVTLVAVADAVAHFNRNSMGVLKDAITTEIPMSAAAFGTLSALSTYTYLALMLPIGVLTDRYGIRRVLSIGFLITAIGGIVFGLASGLMGLYAGRLLVGVGLAIPALALQKLVASWFEDRRATTVIGVSCGIASLGAFLSQLPLSTWLALTSWRMIYLTLAAVSALIGLAVALTLRNSAADCGHLPKKEACYTAAVAEHPPLSEVVKNIVRTFSNPHVWPIFVILFAQMGLFNIFASTWAVSYLEASFGLSSEQAASYTSLMMIGMIVASTFIGGISDLLKSRKKAFLIIYCSLAIGWIMITFFGSFSYSAGIMWLLMLLIGVSATSTQIGHAYVRDVTDPRFVGTSISCVSMVNMFGGAVMPPICGALLDHYEAAGYSGLALYRCAFAPFAVIALLALGVVIVCIRETGCQNRWQEWQQKKH